MICKKCGASTGENEKYCGKCGTFIESNAGMSGPVDGQTVCGMAMETESDEEVAVEAMEIMPSRVAVKGRLKGKTILFSLIALVLVAAGGIMLKSYITSVNANKQINLGNKYLQDGSFEEAIQAFSKAAEMRPKSAEARLGLGKSYMSAGKADDARDALEEVLDLQPKNLEAVILLSDVYIDLELPDKAEKIINEGLKIDGKNSGLKIELAKVYFALNKEDDAEGLLSGMIESDSENPELYIELSKIYMGQYKYDDTVAILEKGVIETKNDGIIKALDDINNKLKYTRGNTPGNILNNGSYAVQGEWVYGWDKDGLYKWKLDGTDKKKISDDSFADQINVIGDWVYYNGDQGYCKIKTDGTGKANIAPGGYSANVVGEWIYYCALDGNGDIVSEDGELSQFKMYKVKIDGTENTKISEDNLGPYYAIPYIDVEGDWIYYNNADDNFTLYKMKTDGTESKKCFDGELYNVNISGDWMYYGNRADTGKLYKIKLDGTEQTKLSDDVVTQVNVSGDWIYYLKCPVNDSDMGYMIYKVKTDGTRNTKVCDDVLSGDYDGNPPAINLAGEWIYYFNINNDTGDTEYYRIKTDGTNKQVLK